MLQTFASADKDVPALSKEFRRSFTFLYFEVSNLDEIIQKLKDKGCDAVALSCTEIPLLITDADSPLPTLDSTRILARAALREANK